MGTGFQGKVVHVYMIDLDSVCVLFIGLLLVAAAPPLHPPPPPVALPSHALISPPHAAGTFQPGITQLQMLKTVSGVGFLA